MGPKIGVTCCLDAGKKFRGNSEYFYVRRDYSRQVRAAGAVPLLLSADTDPVACARLCDGLVITGGDDLPNEFNTGDAWDPRAVKEEQERIDWERELLDHFVAKDRPVLGICYGMQLANLHFGGTLTWCNEGTHGGQGIVSHHPIQLLSDDLLPERVAGETITVNSSHRQAIGGLAPTARLLAQANDGAVEAFSLGKITGVQWHPETDPSTMSLYRRFADKCRS